MPAPEKKLPSTGEMRRRLKRFEKTLDRQNRHKVAELGNVVAHDREWLAAENERLRVGALALADYADSLAIAARMAADLFGNKGDKQR